MQYSLPRLARMWAHLDRERRLRRRPGRRRGPRHGRETDRSRPPPRPHPHRPRQTRTRAGPQAARHPAQGPRDASIPHAAIVGYTNAGKSTLLNRLTGSDVLAKDKLFATLDTTTRRIELPDGQPLLLTDTVGFIRNLPHRLVEAFKATLEEAVLADFLIHVLDATAPEIDEYHDTTLAVLDELGAGGKRMITVLNKTDQVDDPARLAELRHRFPGADPGSALTGLGMDALRERCSTMLGDRVRRLRYRIPQRRADLVGLLHRDAKVLGTDYEGNDVIVTAVVPAAIAGRLDEFADEG